MRYNYNFAKLVNNKPQFAPVPIALSADITIDGIVHNAGGLSYVFNRADVLLQLGYKPVQRTEMPAQDGYYYIETWTETENAIVQGWEEHEMPPNELTDAVNALETLGYTEGGE